MYQKLKKRTEGFTIIEVLIVLAIAGLIMLIVFLAVPALQRNSRNTQRRDDVAKILGLVQEYTNSNNGQAPNTALLGLLQPSKQVSINGGSGTQTVSATMAYYDASANGSVTWNNSATTNNTTVDSIVLRTGAVCDGSTGNATTTGATGRSVVALYTLEPNVKQCQAS